MPNSSIAPNLHILRPNNPKFLPRVRLRGARNYQCLHPALSTKAEAIMVMAEYFAASEDYKRGDVLMVTDDYYEPHILCEIVRK